MKRVSVALVAVCGLLVSLSALQANQAGIPAFTGAQAEAGRALYFARCAGCHGSELQGGGGPALSGAPYRQRWFSGQRPLTELFTAVNERMPPDAIGSLSERQVVEAVAFILQRNGLTAGPVALDRVALATSVNLAASVPLPTSAAARPGAAPAGGQAAAPPIPRPARFPAPPASVKPATTAVPDDKEILAARPEDWLLTSQDVRGQRFSALKQITAGNVAKLVPTCILQLGELGGFQTRPVVHQGRLYVTTTHKTVAMDAATCVRLWEHTYVPKDREPLPNNRGVALYKGKVYRGTGDGHLLALDAATGQELWDVWVVDSQKNGFIAAAPLAINGKLFVAEGGGDFPMDAHIHALDAETGQSLWTFNTIRKDDPKSWPEGVDFGGGANWSGVTYDPVADVIYSPVGNPYPNYPDGGRKRPGDNLYTNSIVGLDGKTGTLRWHAQQEPHDVHDWDTSAPPALYDIGGRKYAAVASKNQFLYIYDRETHAQIAKVPTGRLENETATIPVEGIHACPGHYGGVAQNGQAYDPVLRMLFLGSIDWCDTFYDGKRLVPDKIETAFGWVRGYDAATGKESWAVKADTPIVAAVTPTAGGVVFTGDLNGYLLAYDGKTGKELLRFNTGGPIAGGIVTYEVRGKQYVAVPSGNISRGVPWKTLSASPTMVVFALP